MAAPTGERGGGRVEKDERSRKGPWTEQEDTQLVCYVGLFGQRRWDFLAKVSGLKRTGKSCRLRWVNYLHPGLKRGRMTPEEEHLILQLHAHWGNRWSRIARKLPGRTDNEIKNYWRTHMRKKAQEMKKRNSCTSSSSSSTNEPPAEINTLSTTSSSSSLLTTGFECNEEVPKGYSMDQIWNEIDSSEDFQPVSSSPMWDYCPDQLWSIDADEPKMFVPPMGSDYIVLNYYIVGEP